MARFGEHFSRLHVMDSDSLDLHELHAHSNMVAELLAPETSSASTRATGCSNTLTRAGRCSKTFDGYGTDDVRERQNFTVLIAPVTTSASATPAPISADETARRRAALQEALQQGVDSRYFEKKIPPTFTGKAEDYDKWQRDFRYYISFKSGLLHSLLEKADMLPPRMTIQQLGEFMVAQPEITTDFIAPTLKASRELHGYIRDSLADSTFDCSAVEASGSNGIELWRVLKERYFQATAGSAANELLDILLHTNLYKNMEEFFNVFVAWELRLKRFTERFKMNFPDLLKYALCLQKAPRELITHLCSNVPHDAPFDSIKDAIHEYVRHSLQAGKANFQTSRNDTDAMDVDAVNFRGKGAGKRTSGNCRFCGIPGHWEKDCRKKQAQQRSTSAPPRTDGRCNRCGKLGHFSRDCWSTKGSSKGSKDGGKTSKGKTKGKGKGAKSRGKGKGLNAIDCYNDDDTPWTTAGIDLSSLISSLHVRTLDVQTAVHHIDKTKALLVDSGAAIHVCPPSLFKDSPIRPLKKSLNLQTASGENLPVHGSRRVLFKQGSGYMPIDFIVADVSQGILSVAQLIRSGCKINFSKSGCSIVFSDGSKAHLKPDSDAMPYFVYNQTAPDPRITSRISTLTDHR